MGLKNLRTSLYIPFVDFQINNEDGQKVLYENLVQSGPAYRLVVHESPSWQEIKDETNDRAVIEVLPDKKAEEYKELANRFFAPIVETSRIYYDKNGEPHSTENLTLDLRRALSYVLIAHDYKARIYEDDILEVDSSLSTTLRRSDGFSEEAIKRAEIVEALIKAYKTDTVKTISVNEDHRTFHDLMDLLDNEEIKLLSEMNYHLGVINAKKDVVKRDIEEKVTEILKNEYFPFLMGGVMVAISCILSLKDIEGILSLFGALEAKLLSKFDFREYAPPIQNPRLYSLGRTQTCIFSYKPFNYEVKILVPKRP